MKVDIIKIGNSRGIRIPSVMLKQCQIDNAVDLTIEDNSLILSPCKNTVRHNWEQSFYAMSQNNDDFIEGENNIINVWDNEEWQW